MIFFKQKAEQQKAADSQQQNESQSSGLRSRLKKTRQALGSIFGAGVKLDDSLIDDLEDHLIMADMGMDAVDEIMTDVRFQVKSDKIRSLDHLIKFISQKIALQLETSEKQLVIDQSPFVLLLVGVNGVGKTTTAARLAYYYQSQGLSVMLAACDTFRAAAIEQLQSWGQNLKVPVVAQAHGADAAAVAHDAYESANAKNIDLLIIDTAGRQHTHASLMDQLAKVNRVLEKLNPDIPHESIIVLDAGTGQNALSQVGHFNDMVPLSGMIVTKLDGTAKGGVLVALTKKYGLPVRFIGVGEAMGDLRVFNAQEFAQALLPENLTTTE